MHTGNLARKNKWLEEWTKNNTEINKYIKKKIKTLAAAAATFQVVQ